MQVITVRLPDDLAAALKAQKQDTGCPVEEFVRRAVRSALEFEAALEVKAVRAAQKVLR